MGNDKMEKITSRQISIIKFIFSRILPLIFISIEALLLYYGVKGVLIAIESNGWPHASATVMSSSAGLLKGHPGSDNSQNQSPAGSTIGSA